VICFNGTIVNAPPADADPDDDALPDAAVDPLAAGAADVVLELLSVAFEPQAANVRVAAATRTRADRIESRCTSHLRRFCSPVIPPVRRRRRQAGTYPTDAAIRCTGVRS
jgi:hypothetical protein